MSHQHTTQTSGQGMLERVFKLREHGTTARTEVIAGFTTFLTMVYIVFVNPQILGVAGMDTSAVFVTTCLIAAFGSIMMGLFANLPVALAPAMGLNAFFAFVVVQAMGLPWQIGMGAIFWGAVGLLLLTIFRVRYWMIANIPVSLRVGITSGIGLFIGMMGLKNAGVIVANSETLVSIGNLTSHSVLLGILGFFIIERAIEIRSKPFDVLELRKLLASDNGVCAETGIAAVAAVGTYTCLMFGFGLNHVSFAMRASAAHLNRLLNELFLF